MNRVNSTKGLKIEGLSCEHCVQSVQDYFKEQGLGCRINLMSKLVVLDRNIELDELEKFACDLKEEGSTLSQIES